MKIKLFLLPALLALFSLSFAAVKAEAQLDSLVKKYGELTSWQAVINQTNFFKQSDTTLHSEGNFYWQKGKLCLRYSKPQEQVLLVKDGTVTVYDKSAQTAVRTALSSDLQSLDPIAVVKNYKQYSEISSFQTANGYTTYLLKPTDDPQVKEIRIRISPRTNYIDQFSYVDRQGNKVTLEFKNLKINSAIPASVWKLQLPKGVQLIEN